MTLKEDIIKANSDKVYALMGNGRYTFTYLQEKKSTGKLRPVHCAPDSHT